MRSFEQVRSEALGHLPRFREIAATMHKIPETAGFLEALRDVGLDPQQMLELTLGPSPSSNSAWMDAFERALSIIDEHTPPELREADAALETIQFRPDNLFVLAPREQFRALVEATMAEGGRGKFLTGEEAFWEGVRDLSVSHGGPRRIPKGWAKAWQDKGLPMSSESLFASIPAPLRNGPFYRQLALDFCPNGFFSSWRGWCVEGQHWTDSEAVFNFKFPDGMAEIYQRDRVEGYRVAIMRGSFLYSYGETMPRRLRSNLDNWAQFLLTPHRVRCARGFNALLQEADRQGTELFYSERLY